MKPDIVKLLNSRKIRYKMVSLKEANNIQEIYSLINSKD